MTVTPYQANAAIAALIGHRIRLPLGHELVKWEITQDCVKAIVLTSRVKNHRGGQTVTHRGMTGYQFIRDCHGNWLALEPVAVEWKLDVPEVHTSLSKTQRERLESEAWARLCYRPGNIKEPMDGPGGSNPSV